MKNDIFETTINIQSEIDKITLATIGKMFLTFDSFQIPRSNSQFINSTVKEFANILVELGKIKMVTTIEEADKVLIRLNLLKKEE